MTIERDSREIAINDARALLAALLASGARELDLRVNGAEIYVALEGAGPSPVRRGPASAVAQGSQAGEVVAVATVPATQTAVKAPHVVTVVSTVPVGTMVAAGQAVATVHVLDTAETVQAPVAGAIVRVDAAAGDLLDFGTVLLVIEEVAG